MVPLLVVLAAPAYARGYIFTNVADGAEDGFDPFSFECSAINNRGDIAFRTARSAPGGGSVVEGIYRTNRKGKLTTIAEELDFLGQIPSINDLGEVAFAETRGVVLGSGKKLTIIASAAEEFSRFGFEPTVNNSSVVAFKAELDPELNFDHGLFSGVRKKRRALTTHYLASTSLFSEFGSLSRPSINNLGDIAFEESVDGKGPGIFVTEGDSFKTIAAPDPNVIVDRPNLNDAGTVVFHRFFNAAPGEELVSGNDGPLTIIADTQGPFQSFGFFFGFQAPALNNNGDVAFTADLDSGPRGIFIGRDPVTDRVIETGETLDGMTITNLRFCEEGLNDSGQLAFQATFNDPSVPEGIRVAIFRATPVGPLVTSASAGRAERLGSTNAKITLAGQVAGAFLTDLALGTSTVEFTSILNEEGVELVASSNLPILLATRPGGDTDEATFETPGGMLPKVRLDLSLRNEGVISFRLVVELASSHKPDLCTGTPRTVELTTSFQLRPAPIRVTLTQPWQCLADDSQLRAPIS
jgi:hypothetical protein